MRKKTRKGSDHIGNSNKRQKATGSMETESLMLRQIKDAALCFEDQFGTLYNSGQGVWNNLSEKVASNLSRSVVSIALFHGKMMLFACSGIAISREPHFTRFLTSSSFVRFFNATRKIDDNLRIQVRLPSNEIVTGYLELYDEDITVVTVMILLRVYPVHLNHQVQLRDDTTVVAAGRTFSSGALMATSGMLIDDIFGLDCELPSTCKITKAGLGGPLIDMSGNFIGMNLLCDTEKSFVLLSCSILQRLRQFKKFSAEKQGVDFTWKGYIYDTSMPCTCNSYSTGSSSGESKDSSEEDSLPSDSILGVSSVVPPGYIADFKLLDSMGYPKPSLLMIDCGGKLLNTFEEEFGDILHPKWANYYVRGSGEVVWHKLYKSTARVISRRVVSLASFNGGVRFFACTGLIIKWNGCTTILTSASLVRTDDDKSKIVDNLRIEVFLPPNQRVTGTLQYYDLSYNIAIISVKGFHCISPEDICRGVLIKPNDRVIAIGRIFEEGTLMATSGEVTANLCRFDCKDLVVSTCKIKKAGIGGPLVDADGSFVGMNFYDEEDTPFLPREKILEVLMHFDEKGTCPAAGLGNEVIGDCELNRWPVPKPYWYHALLDDRVPPPYERQRRLLVPVDY